VSGDGRLAGKRTIVTGAGRGLGRAIAARFAEEGADVAVVDIDEDSASEVAGTLSGRALGVGADIADRASVERAFSSVTEQLGGLEVLVNCAAIAQPAAAAVDTEPERIEQIFRVNVFGVGNAARAALPRLSESRGAMINIASNAALRPRPGAAWYNASKGAVVNLTLSLAAEWARLPVRVNAIAPSMARTQMMTDILGEDPEGRLEDMILKTIPLGRFCEGSDVAAAAVYLASDEASYVTGVIVPVDGGRMVA